MSIILKVKRIITGDEIIRVFSMPRVGRSY